MLGILRFITLASILMGSAQAGELFTSFPDEIDPGEKYVFYSHGLIVEGTDPRPVHPRYGVYDFPAIKAALADSDFNVIAYQRPAGTDPKAYARILAGQVRDLLAAGVDPKNVTILGFSRGGQITAYASNELRKTPVNTIIMAGCLSWVDKEPDIRLSGDALSIYETSDFVGSCRKLADRSPGMLSFEELAISTGKEHGAFFTPRPEWLEPVKSWIDAHSR